MELERLNVEDCPILIQHNLIIWSYVFNALMGGKHSPCGSASRAIYSVTSSQCSSSFNLIT